MTRSHPQSKSAVVALLIPNPRADVPGAPVPTRHAEGPHYPLGTVQRAVAHSKFRVPVRVERHLKTRGWNHEYVQSVVAAIRLEDFHKSQSHRDREGVWLDIYRPWFEGYRMYVKITAHEDAGWLLVLSFCRDGEQH